MRKSILRAAVALTGCAVLVSCSSSGDGSPGPSDTTPPTVSQLSITDDQTDVGLVESISVTFSEDMDAETITDSTVTVASRSLAGYVDYDEDTRTATFTPDTLYAAETWHDFALSGDITDEAGNPLEPQTVSFETGVFDCDHLADQLEPNDTYAEAKPLELNKWYRSMTLCQGNSVDWYTFTVDQTEMVTLLERYKRADGTNRALYFRRDEDEDFGPTGTSPENGDSLHYYHFTFRPGTYHLMATAQTPEYLLVDYKLETSEACEDDEYEDNDFPVDAVPITEGTLTGLKACWLDRDFFSIYLDAGQTLTITVTSGGSDGTRRVAIYNPSEQTMAVQTSSSNPMVVSATATVSGVHYFKARFWKDGVTYDMDVDVE